MALEEDKTVQAAPIVVLSPRDCDAVLFDLDGVLTRTARVHAAAWKQLFDEFLRRRRRPEGVELVLFDEVEDYRRYVDGKPRLQGVASFLAARGISLPWGSEEQEPGYDSVCALGKLKDHYFLERLRRDGVEVYAPAVAVARALREVGIATAVVSSSVNCLPVLEAADIAELFDVRVDGHDVGEGKLAGKPAPDTYLEAARRLHVDPSRAVVVEDAESGVRAGQAGGFGLVIGVDRGSAANALLGAGATVVVTSLAEVSVVREQPSTWELVYEGFDPKCEGLREALCTLGNGRFATRGAMSGVAADGVHYPGTYVAGIYNRLRTEVNGETVENEDLVNFPNWLDLTFRIDDGDWFDLRNVTIHAYRQTLDLRRGLLRRDVEFEDARGRRTTLRTSRLVSMAKMNLAAEQMQVTADNWSGRIRVRSGLDGRVVNAGAKLYSRFNNRHLVPVSACVVGDDAVCLVVETSGSRIQVAEAARLRAFVDGQPADLERKTVEEPGYIGQELDAPVQRGQTLRLEKVVALVTSRDPAIFECGLEARKVIARAGPFPALAAAHIMAWHQLWQRYQIETEPAGTLEKYNALVLFRLHVFHLLQTLSLHSLGLDVGVPARGWTGEAYQGHVFWDELFILPFFNYRVPEITRAMLMYRYRRLPEARAAAREAGFAGAMFPWQSASDGTEQTQLFNLNPRSQRWKPDYSHLQRHVGSAIAWNAWQYYQVTRDVEFLDFHGAELILEIARFWSSIATWDETKERYVIRGIVGPDEYHESYPGADEPGLDNNAYTNLMAVWVMWRALDVLERLSSARRAELMARLALSQAELQRWQHVSTRMFVPFRADGMLSQFEGYDDLEELDWARYRKTYGHIERLDLILEAEGDSTNRYKLSKQADVLMLFYLFSAEELAELFARLGYPFDPTTIPPTVDYYTVRSSHGSTLSRVVHAWVLARSDRERAATFFIDALHSDVSDIQQGTSAEGVHLGAMAGTVDILQRVTTGIEVHADELRFNPRLPEGLTRIAMRIRYRGHSLDVQLEPGTFTVRSRDQDAVPIRIAVGDDVREFRAGNVHTYPMVAPPPRRATRDLSYAA